MPEAPPSQPALTSQDIVRTYVDGWRTTHDQDPDLAILNRVRGSAKSLASTRTTPESWQAALSAARSAGAASRYDLIGALAPMPARYPEPEPDPEPSWMRRRLTP